jgi:hypothetical protein
VEVDFESEGLLKNIKMLFDGLWPAFGNRLAKLDDLPNLPTEIAAVTVC